MLDPAREDAIRKYAYAHVGTHRGAMMVELLEELDRLRAEETADSASNVEVSRPQEAI